MNIHTTVSPPRRDRNRLTSIVAGVVAGVLAALALATGGALTWLSEAKTDEHGFYATEAASLSTPTFALVSDRVDLDAEDSSWLLRHGRLGTIRVTASGTVAKPVFVGVARAAAVDAYLAGVAHEQVTDFDVDPFSVESVRRAGPAAPAAPAAQAFWAKKTSGRGTQTLSWPVRGGDWKVVVMNADGSARIETDVSVGAKVPLIAWLGAGLLAGGTLLVAVAAVVITLGARKGSPRTQPSGLTLETVHAPADTNP